MARAIAVHHGSFGRATLYELDNPLITHAHREGHLIFYLGGGRGKFVVRGECYDLDENNAVAVSPWEPHSFSPVNEGECSYVLTLYIKPMWFLENNRSAEFALKFGTPHIHMLPEVEKWVGRLTSINASSSKIGSSASLRVTTPWSTSWPGGWRTSST